MLLGAGRPEASWVSRLRAAKAARGGVPSACRTADADTGPVREHRLFCDSSGDILGRGETSSECVLRPRVSK